MYVNFDMANLSIIGRIYDENHHLLFLIVVFNQPI